MTLVSHHYLNQLVKAASYKQGKIAIKQTPYISPDDIIQVIQGHGRDVQFLSDHTMKQKTNDYSKIISGYRNRLSESTKQKFRTMFNNLIKNATIYQLHMTHCYIHLYENSYFYLLLIVLSSKYVIVDSITQRNTGVHIQGWLNYPNYLSGIQLVDGDSFYELDDQDTKQKQITIDNQNVWVFDLFVENNSTSILPLIVHKFGRVPILQFFSENQIGEVELKEIKSQQSSTHPIIKQLQLLQCRDPLQPIKSNLQNKIDQIKGQKYTGFEQEHYPKIPQTNSKNLQLFRIEENQYEQSSAKHDDLESYTKNLESKYLNIPKPPCLIDGLISSESQMMEKSGNQYLPLTHKEQPTLSEIRNQTVNTQDSAINEHLNMLDPKQLQNIYQDLCREMETPANNLLQSQQIQQQPSYSVESLYFANSQQHSNRNMENQNPDFVSYKQNQPGQQWNQQPQQQQTYQQSQIQQYFSQQPINQQPQISQQQIEQQQCVYYQQMLQQQYQQQLQYQQYQQYQMMLYHQQLQQYPNNLQIKQPEEQFYFDEPDPDSPPKKWSFSPQKLEDSSIVRKRTSNPEHQKKLSHKYSIRQSIRQQKKSEFQASATQKILQREGAQIKENDIPFKCKLKINSILPSDFTNLKSNRAQKKIKEIETGLIRQSMKLYKDHNFNALYRNDKFSDVTLIINGHSYRSHKTVLIQVSPYFHELFEHDQTEVIMKVERFPLFDIVYKYIYLGKLTDSDWTEIGIQQAIPCYRLAEKLQLYQLIELLISRVVIPMMTIEFVLDWYIIGFRNTNMQVQHIFKYVYVYTVTFFSLHCKSIIEQIRCRNDKSILQDQEIIEKYQEIFEKMTAEELYFLIQQPLMQTDQDGIDHLLWLITKKKQCAHIELLKQLSLDHQQNCGFSYKEFTCNQFEQNLPLISNQIAVFPQKLQETKKRRSSLYVDQEFQYSESLFDEYSFYQHNDGCCKLNKLVYEIKLHDLGSNCVIVSECFSSQSVAWRLIIEINDKSTVSIYLQERGSVKNNLKYMNLEDSVLDESLPQYAKLNFISILLKIVICNNSEQFNERHMYHTYPTNQFHTVGFKDMQQINSTLHVKIYIQEDPLHSALMNWCGNNFTSNIESLPYFTLYSLLKSDMLKISEEKQLLSLFYKIKENQQNLDLLIHPIRYFYIPIGDIFSLSRDCHIVRQNQLFQSILNMILTYTLDGKSNNQKPRKTYQKVECQINRSEFKKQWLKWLIYSDSSIKINVDDFKKELMEGERKKEKAQQPQYFQVYNFTPKRQFETQPQSPKCNIF